MQTSVLGFGCGSVLGRVGRGPSLRAMNAAWDEGITLFDTARNYGYGYAEAVLGEFLHGKRDQAIVATKFGILPQDPGLVKRMVVPMARAALQMKVPGMRNLVRRGGEREAALGHFTVQGLRASLEASLTQLRTDYVDVLFLHEASTSAMRQQDLMAELDTLVRSGKVRRVGLYAGADVAADGLTNGPATMSAMQFGADAFDSTVAAIAARNQRGALLIGNHPFASEQRVASLAATLAAMSGDKTVPADLREKLRGADWQLLLEAIFGVVLNCIGAHALVFSMMREDHLRANIRAVESTRFTRADLSLMHQSFLIAPAAELPL